MTYLDDKFRLALGAAAAVAFFGCVSAHPVIAQNVSGPDGPIACGDFQRGPNGSWAVLRPTTMS